MSDDDPNFHGLVPEIEHRTAGPHRAWSFASSEWCYPGNPCAHCDRTIRERAENIAWLPDRPDHGTWIIPEINPEPWTAPEVSIGRRGGKLAPQVFKREGLRQYQEAVHEYVERVYNPTPCEAELVLQFWFWRELDTTRSKLVDATNLQKATEDALHGLLFVNDRQVQDVRSIIVEQGVDVAPTIVIRWAPFVGVSDPSPLQMRQALLDELAAAPKTDNVIPINPESIF